ncbi:hypothetical protein B0H13DRAFT_2316499 [Mycena leptocephala]|nr:hypothetical protein B0H13DRAFT_2316499 [Mycena leptocephala]
MYSPSRTRLPRSFPTPPLIAHPLPAHASRLQKPPHPRPCLLRAASVSLALSRATPHCPPPPHTRIAVSEAAPPSPLPSPRSSRLPKPAADVLPSQHPSPSFSPAPPLITHPSPHPHRGLSSRPTLTPAFSAVLPTPEACRRCTPLPAPVSLILSRAAPHRPPPPHTHIAASEAAPPSLLPSPQSSRHPKPLMCSPSPAQWARPGPQRPPATSGICLGMAWMVITTRSHVLAALNSLRCHSLASMCATPTADLRGAIRHPPREPPPAPLQTRRRGKIYVTTCISDADVDEYWNGTLAGDDLLTKLQFKVGHTSSLTRRCHQYRKCENSQTHIWLWSYDAPQCYLAERLIHLRLFGCEAHTVPQICLGCGVKHHEFFCLAFVGGLRGLDKLVKEVLGLLGQKSVKRTFFKSPAGLNDIWDLLKI